MNHRLLIWETGDPNCRTHSPRYGSGYIGESLMGCNRTVRMPVQAVFYFYKYAVRQEHFYVPHVDAFFFQAVSSGIAVLFHERSGNFVVFLRFHVCPVFFHMHIVINAEIFVLFII